MGEIIWISTGYYVFLLLWLYRNHLKLSSMKPHISYEWIRNRRKTLHTSFCFMMSEASAKNLEES